LLGRVRHLHTDAIGFSYNVTWNTVRRNIFNWKHAEVGKLEAKVKSFCAIAQVLAFLKDYIVFAEKDEELNKYILHQHQTDAQPRARLAHPGQRQDLHDDQGGRTALPCALRRQTESTKPTAPPAAISASS